MSEPNFPEIKMATKTKKQRVDLEAECKKHGVKYVKHRNKGGSVEFYHPMRAPSSELPKSPGRRPPEKL
jgi:hypothetical protein